MKRSPGFTLIELLIALVIFSLISVSTLASVNHLMRAREQQLALHAVNEQLDLAYAHLFQDLIWFVGSFHGNEKSFSFLRTQTSHPDSMIAVRYHYQEGKLYRTVEDETQPMLLLDKIGHLQLSWMMKNQQWVTAVDQRGEDDLPLLLRVRFTTPTRGEVTWVFATPHL
jgi:prepilin-type N-terminal cleavage/methylation domain-containing protein